VETRNGVKRISHGGGIQGFNTFLSYYPDDKLVVVALANINGPVVDQLAGKLGSVARGEQVLLASERKEVPVSPSILAKYVGTYEFTPAFSIATTLEDGHLMTQATNQPKFPIFPESETKFFLKTVDAEVEFIKNEKGEVTQMVLHQGGRDMKGVKK